MLLTLVVVWLICVVGTWVFRRGLMRGGFQRIRLASGDDCVESQEVVPYDPEVFAGGGAPPECYICLQEFGPSKQIRRTECGHHFHADCLRPWLRMARTC